MGTIGVLKMTAAAGALAIALFFSGCGGLELGGRLGVYRVDDRQEQVQVKTINQPMKCLFVPCNQSEVQGS